jgi:Na+-driven multidrug efflux pump
MLSIANTIGNYVAAGYNDLILAAYGINRRIFSMAMMTLTGLAEGSQPIIGYSYGARKIDRMNKVIKTSIYLASGIALFFVAFFYLFAGKMIQIFINNKEVISYGIQIMRAMIIGLPLMAIQFLIRVTFQALGKGKPAFMLALARDFFYIPALFAGAPPILFNSIRGQASDGHRE